MWLIFEMDMYNADGSQGAMCGNGIRCVAKYVYDYGLTDKTRIHVATKSGIKVLDLTVKDGKVQEVCVDMGAPILKPEEDSGRCAGGRSSRRRAACKLADSGKWSAVSYDVCLNGKSALHRAGGRSGQACYRGDRTRNLRTIRHSRTV